MSVNFVLFMADQLGVWTNGIHMPGRLCSSEYIGERAAAYIRSS